MNDIGKPEHETQHRLIALFTGLCASSQVFDDFKYIIVGRIWAGNSRLRTP